MLVNPKGTVHEAGLHRPTPGAEVGSSVPLEKAVSLIVEANKTCRESNVSSQLINENEGYPLGEEWC